jgi:hypothetical protein
MSANNTLGRESCLAFLLEPAWPISHPTQQPHFLYTNASGHGKKASGIITGTFMLPSRKNCGSILMPCVLIMDGHQLKTCMPLELPTNCETLLQIICQK